MQECLLKEPRKCIWFTQENKDELLKIEEPNTYKSGYEFQIRETEEYICIDYCGAYKAFYYYNHWYVEECHDYEYPEFYKYTKAEFEEKYNLYDNYQWYSEMIKPEGYRNIIVKDENGKEYNNHYWNGLCYYEYSENNDGTCDGYPTEVDFYIWRYKDNIIS